MSRFIIFFARDLAAGNPVSKVKNKKKDKRIDIELGKFDVVVDCN